jgi:D-glycero-D-manno-heptose 1,7-bisphosphate phosphatase
MERFVLVDRDGVINRRIMGGYVMAWEECQFLPGAFEGLALLARHNISALVISNQACVGKGLLAPDVLDGITQSFVKEIEGHGGRIGGVYYCPHRPEDACDCRKPKPGLILQAQRKHGFRFRETYLIGDSPTDLAAAHAAGCPALLIAEDRAALDTTTLSPFEGVFPSLAEAARFVIAHPLDPEPPALGTTGGP